MAEKPGFFSRVGGALAGGNKERLGRMLDPSDPDYQEQLEQGRAATAARTKKLGSQAPETGYKKNVQESANRPK